MISSKEVHWGDLVIKKELQKNYGLKGTGRLRNVQLDGIDEVFKTQNGSTVVISKIGMKSYS